MKVDVEVEARIERAPAEVAAFAGDPSNAPAWYRRISSAEWVSEPAVAVGNQIRFHARFLGRDLRYTYEITELLPGERMTMRTVDGPFPMTTEYSWEPADGGSATVMSLRNHGEPSGFARLTAPFVSLAMRRAMGQDLKALANILEPA